METRKIQKVGGSTFTVSIPKEWAREHGLETGEMVRLYTHRDGSLIVRGRQVDGERLETVSISVGESSVDTIDRSIQGAYEAGFERITLHAEQVVTDEQRRAARKVARQFVGTEVIDASPKQIVVRAMLDASAVSIHQSIDQTVTAISAMQGTVCERLRGGDGTSGQVTDRLTDVTRLVALVRRHYNRSLVTFEELDALGIDRVALSQYYRVADRLEGIATATVRLNETIDDVSLSAERAGTVADRLTTLTAAVTEATRHLLEGSATASIESPSTALEQTAETALDGDSVDPSLARSFDHLRRIEDAVRAIERIGLQSSASAR
ncbi:MAG: AbrB/MazE/SpoVT family DNA-binding domain-containing protein [Halorhabdus sp.]